jgi:hypothetical protein
MMAGVVGSPLLYGEHCEISARGVLMTLMRQVLTRFCDALSTTPPSRVFYIADLLLTRVEGARHEPMRRFFR